MNAHVSPTVGYHYLPSSERQGSAKFHPLSSPRTHQPSAKRIKSTQTNTAVLHTCYRFLGFSCALSWLFPPTISTPLSRAAAEPAADGHPAPCPCPCPGPGRLGEGMVRGGAVTTATAALGAATAGISVPDRNLYQFPTNPRADGTGARSGTTTRRCGCPPAAAAATALP